MVVQKTYATSAGEVEAFESSLRRYVDHKKPVKR